MVAVKGSCPLLTFSVAGTMIWMDSTTVLNGLSCAQLTNGTIVRVSGLRRQDRFDSGEHDLGSAAATWLHIDVRPVY